MRTKKVLIVSYIFPPMGGGGVFRVTKFCKYLPQFNWTPVVLTVKEHDTEHFDETLLEQIPEVLIHGTYSIDLPLLYKKHLKKKTINSDKSLISESNSRKRVIERVKRFIDHYILIPDSRIGWIPFALLRGYTICKREKIDVIFSTGGPWTNHLIGLSLKIITTLPWVADYRDPWNQRFNCNNILKLRQRIEKKMEKAVLSKANWVVTATHSIADDLKERYPGIDHEKFITIPNGFDKHDFSNVNLQETSGFTITHTGDFYGTRKPHIFLEALRAFLNENGCLDTNVRVNFVGKVDTKSKELIQSMGLQEVVQCVGSVSHKESIQWMLHSDILLLIIGSEEYEVTGKIYEYMAANKPILALAGEGEASDLLRKTDMATLVNSTNVIEIKNAIYTLYSKKKAGQLEAIPNVEVINKYNRIELTRQLSILFDNSFV